MDVYSVLTLILIQYLSPTVSVPLKIVNLNETAICATNSTSNYPLCVSLRSKRALPLVSMLTAIPVLADSLSVMEAAQKTYSKINDYLGDDNNNEDSNEDEPEKKTSKKGTAAKYFKAPPGSVTENSTKSAHELEHLEHLADHHHHHHRRRPIVIVQNIVVNLPAPNASTGNFSHLIVNLSNGSNVPAVMISSLTNATMSRNTTRLFEDLAEDFELDSV